jgi:hypothetical protein
LAAHNPAKAARNNKIRTEEVDLIMDREDMPHNQITIIIPEDMEEVDRAVKDPEAAMVPLEEAIPLAWEEGARASFITPQ